MLRTFFRRNILLLSVTIATLMAVLGVAVSQLFQTSRYMDEVHRSADRLIAIREVQRKLNDAETGQRGYLLTGESRYLEPYRHVAEGIMPYFAEVLEKCEGRGDQARRVEEMRGVAVAKLAELKNMIEIQDREGKERALDYLRRNAGESYSVKLRELIATALREEEKYQARLRARQDRGLWVTTGLIVGGTLLSVAAAVNAYLLFRKAVKAARVQQRLIYQRRRAVHADREKSRFLANMSHEIRTPMNAILGFGQLLQDEVQTPRAKQYVKAISSAGENLLGLINDVLDLSKIESGRVELRPEVVDVRDTVESLRLLLSHRAEEKGLDLRAEVAEDCPCWLKLDVIRFRQMLLNLLSNAVKFTERGHVTLRLRCVPMNDAEKGNRVLLQAAVEDTGPGIAPADYEKIFLPFRQGGSHSHSTHGGTGLGLSITRRLAQIMGGTVELSSRPGHGSTFTLTLPDVEVAEAGAVTEPAPDAGEDGLADLPPLRVLIVDDNAYNREVLGGFFRDTPHRISYAADGLEGVESALRERPDVILMDIRMPRLDGREARSALRKHEELAFTPIIAVTASNLADEEEKEARNRFDGYLRKPFLRPQLAAVIRQALEAVAPSRLRVGAASAGESARREAAFAASSSGLSEEVDTPGLAAALEDLEKRVWPQLSRTMGVRAVSAFAESLGTLAGKHGNPSLRAYADRLRGEAASFEISRMQRTVQAFPELVRSIAGLSSPSSDASASLSSSFSPPS